ncbi:tryptophan synthase subunit alpha [Sphingosinicella rhizophila]|uniref:Tryptophan synthase alpha chain n=1 Tax=Sphingosinicella rhizophila TaxID=3050082 RepID=A0ABU3Q342_9SPHN|nr:tryptophan synthase subunit alpha [Sphingosinicella sp. GR2756]MDT9597385.1 tryptophan synthase subunit alpha [Sphingosinicella sp. GR2756]
MNRYDKMFARLNARKEGAFGAFVMLGDPNLERSAVILDALAESGADMLEVGIPFSDPIADGPVIQAAADRALKRGVTPADCFGLLQGFRARHPEIPAGILTYANLVLARGREAFYRSAAEAGVDSILVADVPMLEAEPFVDTAAAHDIAPVLIAATNTPGQTLTRISRAGKGYTYCVARAGVTGTETAMQLNHGALFAALKVHGAPPPVLGFGISTPEHVRAALDAGAAGVISGSAVVKLVEADDEALSATRRFVREMKAATGSTPNA